MLMKGVERLVKEMTKCHYDENCTESQVRFGPQPADEHKGAGTQFDEWNDKTNRPERPRWEEGVLIREEEAPHVTDGSE